MTLPYGINAPTRAERLDALRNHVRENINGINDVAFTEQVNNHVHTTYSFSPYSPAAAAWSARAAGLRAVGSVDHDSIAAATEMLEACSLLAIGGTVGCELRVSFAGTPLEGRRINNPDGETLAYIVFHGVPAPRISEVDAYLAPIRDRRNERNREQTEAMSGLLAAAGAPAPTFNDVVAVSNASEGGSITERHILYAASRALVDWLGRGESLRRFVEDALSGPLRARLRGYLDDEANPHYVYDLLGALRSSFLPRFYVQPSGAECPPVAEAVELANSVAAIPAYAYLGDVAESPTGDKKAAAFEDGYLDELFQVIAGIGFRAVTYMPPRNTVTQLLRVQALCRRHALMEISGVDINSSRQDFTCEEILRPEFRHLTDATWALVAHERLSSASPDYSLFSPRNPVGGDLPGRIERYAAIGRALDPRHPDDAVTVAGFEGGSR
ncbi:MAG: PHP domain-containing protein [Spirochaetota bacterium]